VERIAQERVWSYRHEIHTEVTGSPAVRADGERLALVIRNLMYEAIRSSPARTPLTVMARPDGAGVAVGVRYQPLPPEDRANAADSEYDDMGIGRSVAETIVAGHGGSLRDEISDTANTSWIHLPASRGAHA
jgi:signal transduction histidine kinase